MIKEILRGHTSPETAYVCTDYPYGRDRTSIRWWLETATKGSKKGETRFVSQTLNPKTNMWNKPHPGQYSHMMLMYKDEIGHVHTISCNYPVYLNDLANFLSNAGPFLNYEEKNQLKEILFYGMKLCSHTRAIPQILELLEQGKNPQEIFDFVYESELDKYKELLPYKDLFDSKKAVLNVC